MENDSMLCARYYEAVSQSDPNTVRKHAGCCSGLLTLDADLQDEEMVQIPDEK